MTEKSPHWADDDLIWIDKSQTKRLIVNLKAQESLENKTVNF